MRKWSISARVDGSFEVGVVEAETEQKAEELGQKKAEEKFGNESVVYVDAFEVKGDT